MGSIPPRVSEMDVRRWQLFGTPLPGASAKPPANPKQCDWLEREWARERAESAAIDGFFIRFTLAVVVFVLAGLCLTR